MIVNHVRGPMIVRSPTPCRSSKRVFFDQVINTGLWYYPLFYVVQGWIMKYDPD